MTTERIERVNYYDFQKIDLEDMRVEQTSNLSTSAANFDAVAGSGILLDSPEELVVFDSDALDTYQQGLDAISAFDGQGILETPYLVKDQVGGSQLAIAVTDTRLGGFLKMSVYVLGKTFEDVLIYEVVEIGANITEITHNHFTEVTNILFQNFLGNTNTTVDGYGSFDVGGRVVITEASSLRLSRDLIAAEQILEPNMSFRNFKTATAGKSLSITLSEAIGVSNDVNDLDINTTNANTRLFEVGGSTSIIYGQKFKLKSNNIQKVSILLSLTSGSTFSGTLVLGIRQLQTADTATTEFLPDDEISFDPDISSIEEIAVDVNDLAERGYILNDEPQIVDFLFTGSNLSNPALSNLVEDTFYVLTIRRTGSVVTGTIVIEEATNSDADLRLTVFDSNVWTDISTSTMWFRIWSDSVKASSGIAYDAGIRVVAPKIIENTSGVMVQGEVKDIDLTITSEDSQNYVLLQNTDEYTRYETHPRTGDLVASRKVDAALISVLEQADVEELMNAGDDVVLLGRVRDRNPRSNPTITGTLEYPCLAFNNTITIVNPGSDLLTQNIVGSTIVPNTLSPSISYRVTSQTTYTDLYGDLNGDGVIDLDDLVRLIELDGYATDLNGGTVLAATQLAAVLNGSVTVEELLRADVTGNGLITEAVDGVALTDFIDNGTAFAAGSSFTRVVLELESIINPILYTDSSANSTLSIEDNDPDLIDNVTFSTINYEINFIPTWEPENIEIIDLRRYVVATFLDFNVSDLTSTPESGGQNSQFIPGDLYISGSVLNIDGTNHPLDYERNIIEIELPEGDTAGEFNLFTNFVSGIMKFSDDTFVSSSAITNNQIKFEVSISSYSKLLDGYDGYASDSLDVNEAIGTYIDHSTGLLRINADNITYNVLYPQLRTRILVAVSLKKAGFKSSVVRVTTDDLSRILVI